MFVASCHSVSLKNCQAHGQFDVRILPYLSLFKLCWPIALARQINGVRYSQMGQRVVGNYSKT